MSERQYAAHVGLSRGAIQRAKDAARLQKLKGERVDKARAETLMFRLARGTRCLGDLARAGRCADGIRTGRGPR